MKKRKLVALLAAATMLLGTVPVSAAQVSGAATGTGSATGEGDVTTYDSTPVYEVTLPTGNVLDFTIDPYNLSGLAEGSTAALSTGTGTSAIIVATDAAAVIKNTSSVPMKIDVDFAITNVASNAATFVATDAGLADMTNPAIYLTMVPSAAGSNTDVITGAAYADTAAVPLDNGTSVSFYLEEADYVIEQTATGLKLVIEEKDNNYKAEIFKLAGSVNKVNGWEAYTASGASLTLSAVFTFNEYTAETAPTLVTGTNALIAAISRTEGFVGVDNTGFYVAKDSNYTGFDSLDGVKLTVNGKNCNYTVVNECIYVSWANAEAADKDEKTNWTFEFTADGVAYTATYTAQ